MLRAVMVEAEDPSTEKMPTLALLELKPILQKLALPTEELQIADLTPFAVLPHIGMVAHSVKCKLGLALVAAMVKSEFRD